MRSYIMKSTYKFTLESKFEIYIQELRGVYFKNEWIKVWDGYVTIKKGYSWDGCSFAPDTIETYIASCIHDAFYQFHFITRKRADKAFYDLLKQNKFPFAKIYYISVRLFGFIFY